MIITAVVRQGPGIVGSTTKTQKGTAVVADKRSDVVVVSFFNSIMAHFSVICNFVRLLINLSLINTMFSDGNVNPPLNFIR